MMAWRQLKFSMIRFISQSKWNIRTNDWMKDGSDSLLSSRKSYPYSENNFSEYHDTKYALQQLIEHSKFISHSIHVTYRLFMEARRRLNGLRGQRRNIPRRGLFIVSRESFVVPLQETA